MPLYEFRCETCGHKFEDFTSYDKSFNVTCPICKNLAKKLISCPAVLITDTSFCMTGKRDKRLGGGPIEGRADWNRRVEEKGYMELSNQDLKDMM